MVYLSQWQGVREGVLVGPGVEGRDKGGERERGEGEDEVEGVRNSQQHQQPVNHKGQIKWTEPSTNVLVQIP